MHVALRALPVLSSIGSPLRNVVCFACQYEGYTFDEDVPNDSTTETFALAHMRINNSRWKVTQTREQHAAAAATAAWRFQLVLVDLPLDAVPAPSVCLRSQCLLACFLLPLLLLAGRTTLVTECGRCCRGSRSW